MSDHMLIYGALRSGSTLLRLMINSHDDLHCPDELDYLFDYVYFDKKCQSWKFDAKSIKLDRIFLSHRLRCPETDDGIAAVNMMLDELRARDPRKLVIMTHRNLNAIIGVLGNPRIVHLIRDPRDVAASSVPMGWAGNVYYGVDHWIKTERQWRVFSADLPEYSTMLLRFENLIAEPEANLMRLCKFYGVQYSSNMLEYHKMSSYQPVDPKLSNQWKHKRTKREVALIEARVGDLLSQSGFSSANKSVPRVPWTAKAGLWTQNKIYGWRVRIQRYGLMDSVILAVARRLGMSNLVASTHHRVNERAKEYLK